MSVKMPKPVSKTELSRLYTRLAIDTHHRLDNSTAEGQARLDLLHRFFDACANLYGTMTLWHAGIDCQEKDSPQGFLFLCGNCAR